MNDTFNIKRFGWLLKKTLLERPIQLVGLLGLILAVVLLAYAVGKYFGDWEVAQNISFILGMVGGGCFLASNIFGYFSTNAGGSSFLTLPASNFEKWLCSVLITGVFFLTIFLLFYRIIDLSFVTIYRNNLDPKGPYYKNLFNSVQILPFDGYIAPKAFMMFFNFAGAMLIGSLYFNKVAFIKVALLLCSLLFGAYFLNLFIADVLFDNLMAAFPYHFVGIKVGSEEGRIQLPDKTIRMVYFCFQFIIPAILWLLVYVRLREKEF